MLKCPPSIPFPYDRRRLLLAVEISPASSSLKPLLSHAVVSGLWFSPFVSARIVAAACAAADLPFAQLAFDASPRRSAFSFTTMIRAHSSGPDPSKSIQIFSHMLRSGFYPDRFTFPFLLRAAARSLSPPSAIHAIAYRHGLDGDAHVATSLLHAYAASSLIDSALFVFDEMPHRTDVTWCAIISCCARSENKQEIGLSLFKQMISAGDRPNIAAIIASLSCCAGGGLIADGKVIHALSTRLLPSSSFDELGTALINMYARSGSLNSALKVFDGITARDSSTWTAMIGGLATHGRGEEAVAIFQRMVDDGDSVQPDGVAFTAVLHACSHAGLVDTGVKLFNELRTVHRIEAKMEHYGAMVDLFGRSGRLEEAALVVASMPFAPNQIVWGSLLNACAVRGELAYGQRLKTMFIKLGFFVGLSNVYAAACRWPEVATVREMMVERGMRKECAFSSL